MKDFSDWKGRNSFNLENFNKEIMEQNMEHKLLVNKFSEAMNKFASDRSFESCLDALNITIQLANVRGNLSKSFEHYSKYLENEIKILERLIQTN
ncbi:MAG: hypothetical protein DA328_01140 [Nitrososphaeraceae archaeon]|nr:hypothetical protein [Nitrososphaeraceae archaeon]